jgi:hypothetical protein
MKVSVSELDVRVRPLRGLIVRVLWVLALVAGLLLLGGAAIVAAALTTPPPPTHDLLHAVLRTRTSLPEGRLIYGTVQLWTDPTASAALVQFSVPQMVIYYQRERAGTWASTGHTGGRGRWQVSELPSAQVPFLLSMDGLRRYFAALRSRAAQVTPVDLNHHLADAFQMPGLRWPYYQPGPTTIWLDHRTGLPLQFRNIFPSGKGSVVVITTLPALRTIPSSRLSADFLTPPDQRLHGVPRLLRRVQDWIAARLG